MDFPKSVITREILRLPSQERDIQSVEFRRDPLTGKPCRINFWRAKRVEQAPSRSVPVEVIGAMEMCPFCPENIDRVTTVFDPGFYPDGQIRRGQCRLFPNMFPLANYHVAATVCTDHFLDIDAFSAQMVIDCVMAAGDFLSLVRKRDPAARYPVFLWNYLSPSAASIVHPHVQVLVDIEPTPYQRTLLENSEKYFRRVGRSFWKDIISEEKRRGERFIYEGEFVAVIASFAPQGNRESQIIFKEAGNLLDLKEREIAGFAECIIRLLRGYKEMGVNSFNLSTFSAPLGENPEYYSLHAKLISRPVLQPFYRNDTGILERFHYDADIEVMPEVFAENARRFF